MESKWSFLTNPFWNATSRNVKRFFKLISRHMDALDAKSADPFFKDLYDTLKPAFVAFVTAYNEWKSAGEVQQGGTQQMKDKLKQLNLKIEDWDLAIQAVYRDKTWQYQALLPHHRTPFQSGSQYEKITAVKSLSLSIGNDANLTAVKASVDDFYAELLEASSTKNEKITKTGTGSNQVQQTHKAACVGMYRVLGRLMDYFAEDPDAIEAYYDMTILRRHEQTDFEGHVKAQSTFSVAKRTLNEGETVTVLWNGPLAAEFFSASSKTQTTAPVKFTLNPNEPMTFTRQQLGNDLEHPFFNFTNSSDADGHFEMDID